MKLNKLVDWLNHTLKVDEFDDVSNNGLQVARDGDEIRRVAVAVDADVESIKAAIKAKAELLIVHHGISWGGGIKRIIGGEYEVIKAALSGNLAIYACHLPLDAHEKYGNNFCLARYLGLKRLTKAFSYHGNIIGLTGYNKHGVKIGLCSGGAGCFAPDAKELGCELYVTGEADWGERVAAKNCGMKMICAGHYETETFGVTALAKAISANLKLKTINLT